MNVHACSNALALVLLICVDTRSPMRTIPAAHLPALTSLPHPTRTQPALVLPAVALHNHTDIHAPARLRAHPRTHFGALSRPHPYACHLPTHSQQRRGDDNDTTIVLSRLSRCCCDHSRTSP